MPDITMFNLALTLLPSDLSDFDSTQFAALLERAEGRVIRLIPRQLPAGLFGMRFIVQQKNQPPEEYVFYDVNLPPAHQEHIRTHELAHIALGHPTRVMTPKQMAALLRNSARFSENLKEISCRADDPQELDAAQLDRDQDAEKLTRVIYQRRLSARQKKHWSRNSSQDDLDDLFHHLGID